MFVRLDRSKPEARRPAGAPARRVEQSRRELAGRRTLAVCGGSC